MKKTYDRKPYKFDKGFTLVELIVVLVIIAILAAVLVPVLMGYIDKSREEQSLIDAQYCVTAIQAELTQLYGKQGASVPLGTPVISGGKIVGTNNGDDNITSTKFAENVLKLAELDHKPYCLVCGLGSNAPNTDDKTTLHDKYTVLFLFYMRSKDSSPMFYFNGEWTHTYPRAGKSDKIWDTKNVIQDGALKGKRIQLYAISNEAWKDHGSYGSTTFWEWLRSYK